MSVDSGGGSTEGWRMTGLPDGTGQHMLASLHETYVPYLYDYCEGLLQDPAAAAEAVQRALSVADAQIAELRDPDRLPAWLYSIARRQCLDGRGLDGRGLDGPPGRSGTRAASYAPAEQDQPAVAAPADI
jgi:DNA-directed RNA polymerase specialized sigma24 family protein